MSEITATISTEVQEVTANIQDSSQTVNVVVQEEVQDVSITISDNVTVVVPFEIEQRTVDLEKSGWISLTNTVNDINNPFSVSDGVEFTLPIRNDSSIEVQADDALKNLIDNSTNKLTVPNLNDSFLMRVQFNLKTVLSGRSGSFDFDIGISERFNHANFKGAENASDVEPVSFLVPFYQLGTFQANGGLIKGRINGSGEIYDIICTVFKLRHGKNI